jgi:hypothetical protein
MASRLLQFLGSLQKVLVNRTADEFRYRSARLLGQQQQLLELLFFEEECRPLHDHTVSHRHIYVNGAESDPAFSLYSDKEVADKSAKCPSPCLWKNEDLRMNAESSGRRRIAS